MGLKQVKSDPFDQILVLVHINDVLVLHYWPNNKMGLKQVKSDAFDNLLVLVDAKPCTCAIFVAKQQNGLKTS